MLEALSLRAPRRALEFDGEILVGAEGVWGVKTQFTRLEITICRRNANFETPQDLATLKELIETGKVTPVIDRTYSLSETPDAIRYLEDGHARGKVVITVSG